MHLKKMWQSLKKRVTETTLGEYVCISISLVIVYTVVVTVLKAVTGADLSSEYATFCAVFGGEMLTCGLVKIFKIRR